MPRKTVEVTVSPEVLRWARETAGYRHEDVARRLRIPPERVAAWERAGPARLTLRFPVTVWSREIPGGFEARVEARTLSGAVVGAAEACCKRDEPNWEDKPDYQLRSMAQTRAAAKALRQCLGFVLVLAGYSTTPAEEMEGVAQAKAEAAEAEDPDAPTCPEHKTRLRRRPAGVSKKTGRAYPPFWSCPAPAPAARAGVQDDRPVQ